MSSPSSTCPECGASIKPGASLCSACLLSVGAATQPVQPAGAGVAALPCTLGDYRLLRKLGAGGMGIVYEADHIPTGRRLALKVLNQSLDNEEQRQRFLREGRLAATIDHPNSVYVFGTEEIEGLPVIAMELAAGGTLRDEVKRRGPLPIRDAVDAILGLVDGLEAAHERGILHRDMKPSNCFLTGEGKAMVGDYGLSISQTNNQLDDEPLTRSGMIVGTPAFSSPEQLRAQPLDQRADIYSTGGTLYYLLTGKAPVERATPVETVAAVLEGRVPNVRASRPEVPGDLAAVIARCLAPQAAVRFGSYAELRTSLLPFSSTAPEPAPLGPRFVAGLADAVITTGLLFLAILLHPKWGGGWMVDEPMPGAGWKMSVASTIVTVLFYAWAECRWGATPGKWLFGLCVAGKGGARPRWHRAALRVLVFLSIALLFEQVATWIAEENEFEVEGANIWLLLLVGGLVMFSQLWLFIPALFRQDRAALHDLLTGIRVILRQKGGARLKAAGSMPVVVPSGGQTWGPFLPGEAIGEGLRHGHDPLLRRPVLLRARDGDAGPSAARRDCARGARLRWLQSVTGAEGGIWDVWQAPAGLPLAEVMAAGTPCWQHVLFWLEDLALELGAAEKDGTLPARLSLDQVWITPDGRALLLDEVWPVSSAGGDGHASPQLFLAQVSALCPAVHRPLHADALMASLHGAAFERLSHISGNLSHLRQKKTEVSRVARAATILGPLVTMLALPFFFLFVADSVQRAEWLARYPGIQPLPQVLDMQHRVATQERWKNPVQATQINTHLAGHYQALKNDKIGEDMPPLAWTSLQQLRKTLKREPVPDAASLAAADAAVQAAVPRFPYAGYAPGLDLDKALPVVALVVLCLVAIFQLVNVIASGQPLLMRLTGIAVVTEAQRPAGRLRGLWRCCVGWAPLWLVGAVLGACAAAGVSIMPVLPEICQVWMPLFLLLIISGLLVPRRSLVDRLAGTWLVAR